MIRRFLPLLFAAFVPWGTALVVVQPLANGFPVRAASVVIYASAIFLTGALFASENIRLMAKKTYRSPYVVFCTSYFVFFLSLWLYGGATAWPMMASVAGIAAVPLAARLVSSQWHERAFRVTLACSAGFALLVSAVQWARGLAWPNALLGIAAHGVDVAGTALVWNGDWVTRLYGVAPHPNAFAAMIVIAMAVLFFLSSPRTRGSIGVGETETWIPAFAGMTYKWILSFLLTWLLLATFSRGALLAAVVAAAVVFGWHFVQWVVRGGVLQYALTKTAFYMAAAALLAVALHASAYSAAWFSRAGASVGIERNSLDERGRQYAEFKDVALSALPLGTGPGNYYRGLGDAYPFKSGKTLQPVHNAWLLFLAEWGVAAVPLLALLGVWLFGAWRGFSDGQRFLVVFVAVSALFDHYWLTSWQAALCLGIAWGVMTSVRGRANLTQ